MTPLEERVRREIVHVVKVNTMYGHRSYRSPEEREMFAKVLREIETGEVPPLPTVAGASSDAFMGAMVGAAFAPLIDRAFRKMAEMPPPAPPPKKKVKKASHLRRVK